MSLVTKISNEKEKSEIIVYCKLKKVPEYLDNKNKKPWIRKAAKFSFKGGNLFFYINGKYKIFFCEHEEEKKISVIESEHKKSHLGTKKIFKMLQDGFYNISRELVNQTISKCPHCIVADPLKTVENLKIISSKKCRERYQMDLIVLYDLSQFNDGYKYILNVIDTFSKFVWSFPLKVKSSTAIVTCLKKYFLVLVLLQSFILITGKNLRTLL